MISIVKRASIKEHFKKNQNLKQIFFTRTCFFVVILMMFGKCLTAQEDSVLLNRYNLLCNKYETISADSLFKYASIQLILAKKHKSVHHQIKAYTNLGVAYTRLFKFDDALACYLMARDVIESNGRTGVSPLLGQIGYIYLRLNRKEEAYKYFKLQESTSLKEENYKSYLSSIVNLSDYYNTLSELDSSILILNKGLSISRVHGFHDNEVIILDNIANAWYAKALETNNKKLFRKVELYADTALRHHYADKDSSAIFYIYGLLGALNMETGNYAKSEDYYSQYISYSKRTQDIINLKLGLDECSALFAIQGKYNKAYQYRLMYDSINKLYVNEEANKQVEELNTKYETEKKEQQNILLKQQNDLSEDAMRQQKLITGFIIASLVASLIFGFFMYRVYSQKKKAHQLITKQKEEVELKQVEIEHQKRVIEEKQKEIVDSINYAKRIQYALLAHDEILERHLAGHCVFFKPKDIVSGDFYWAAYVENDHQEELFFLACCDSTGHGVPGAFMSLLSIGFLSEAIKERAMYEPNRIFDFVRGRIIETVSSDGQQDGFDGILLCINKTSGKITYAAANNAPLLVSGGKIASLSSDKMPVGKGEKTEAFKLYEMDCQPGDTIYLYTDGYPDQFGGPKGKKFKYKPLEELLLTHAAQPMSEQQQILKATLEAWQGNLEQVDDVCVMGIRV
jgi:serine phosphatase RsbU (regulator of sigma subunit)